MLPLQALYAPLAALLYCFIGTKYHLNTAFTSQRGAVHLLIVTLHDCAVLNWCLHWCTMYMYIFSIHLIDLDRSWYLIPHTPSLSPNLVLRRRFDQCHCITNKNFINKIISQITVYWGPREFRNKTIRLQLTTNARLMYLCMELSSQPQSAGSEGGLKKLPDFNSLYSIQMTL